MWDDATSIISSGGIRKPEVSVFTPSSSYTIEEKKTMVTRTVKWQAEKIEAWCGCGNFEKLRICKEVLAVVRHAGGVDLFVRHFQKSSKLFRNIIKPTSAKKGQKASVRKRWSKNRKAAHNAMIREGKTALDSNDSELEDTTGQVIKKVYRVN